MKVCLGGTFSVIHAGHAALLHRAFQAGDEVLVGLTSDKLARQRGKDVPSYEERKHQLERFIHDACNETATIVKLDDPYGPAATGACDAIVVSPETLDAAKEINSIRRSNDLAPLHVITVPYVLADDGIPVSSTRIDAGEIQDGHRVIPLHVAVGTSNEAKQTATEAAFRRLLGHLDIRCTATAVSGVEHPTGEQIWDGAIQRARRCIGSADYGVGIEAGLVERQGATMLEHVCVLVDTAGYISRGTAPAFQLPSGLTDSLDGDGIDSLVPDGGDSLAGYLSGGAVTRKHLVREAVTAALLPRLQGRH